MRLCRHVIQKGSGGLEIGGIEPLGEPVVDRRQQVVGRTIFSLGLPQAG